jgi:PleD family two-component response regulator
MEKISKKILIIDDDNSHLQAAKGILESEGYMVSTHNQAFGSTQIARQLKPDLILLDMNMPGLSGDKLAQVIGRNLNSVNVPILFYSSNDEDSLRKAVVQYRFYGVKDYICKGDPYDLRRKVANCLFEN